MSRRKIEETEQDFEFEFAVEYGLNSHWYLFFAGALVDETETVETLGEKNELSGIERSEMGVGYLFGERVQSELKLGRSEFVSDSDWWLWWDEELDSVRIDSYYGDFESTLGLAQEVAVENTDDDFIDPELEDVRRLLLNLTWEFAAGHSLGFYYLDQEDNSNAYRVGELEDYERLDDEDADLTWTGISYLGEFEIESVGTLELEWHAARVNGDEILYEFDDTNPATSDAEVEERKKTDVSGSARGLRASFTPAAFDDWTLTVGRAWASGDRNPDDNHNESFRQTGLQGESDVFGQLFQPELSNIVIDLIGVSWTVSSDVEIALYHYGYEQDELADEMRDVAIDFDPNGNSKDLGREVDLVLTITPREHFEIIVTVAEFDPGAAYADPDPDADRSGEFANYFSFEIAYEF